MKILNLKGLVLKLLKGPKVLILASIISVILCLAISKLLLSTDYVARAKILVSTDIIGAGGAEEELLIAERVLNTTVEFLKSRDFIKGVVKELNLEDAFGKSEAVDKVLPMVRIRPLKGTDIIEISVRSKKAELATLIANAMSKVVITESAKDRFSFENDIVAWVSEKTKAMREGLEDSRRRLQKFKESTGAADVEIEYNTTTQRLTELQQNLSAIRTERQRFESAYASIEDLLRAGKKLEELPQVMNDPDFKQMQSKYNYNKKMAEELLKKYLPNHPEVTALTAELTELEVSMDSRAKEMVKDIERSYKSAKAEEEKLQKIAEDENKIILGMEERLNEYKTLQEDLKEKEAVFNTFLEKLKEEFVGDLRVQQLSLAEQAYLPQKKESPAAGLVVLTGLLVGMAAGLAYNMLKDKETLFIEKTKVRPPEEKTRIDLPKAKGGMYIERVKEQTKEEKETKAE